MNIVDSSGWLEYFADSDFADFFSEAVENISQLIVPTITIYEVYKKVLKEKSEKEAELAVSVMLNGAIAELNTELSIKAANISITYQLPMADSIIFATALKYKATLYTMDSDFKGLDKVIFFEKK